MTMEVVLLLVERAAIFCASLGSGPRAGFRAFCAAAAVAAPVSATAFLPVASAQDDGKTEAPNIAVELNKLEPQGNSCRAYVVVNNKSQDDFTAYKLDLVMFQPDGVIGRRFAVDLAPIRPGKRTVKLFDIDNLKCDEVGSFLINDVVECSAGGTPAENCLGRVEVSTRAKVEFSK